MISPISTCNEVCPKLAHVASEKCNQCIPLPDIENIPKINEDHCANGLKCEQANHLAAKGANQEDTSQT